MRIYGDETFQCGFEWLFESFQATFAVTGSHSGLSTVRNATGTHSSAAPAFLYKSPPAAPRLIRCRDSFPVRLRLTTARREARYNSCAKLVMKQLSECRDVRINRQPSGVVWLVPAQRPWMSEITIYRTIRG